MIFLLNIKKELRRGHVKENDDDVIGVKGIHGIYSLHPLPLSMSLEHQTNERA